MQLFEYHYFGMFYLFVSFCVYSKLKLRKLTSRKPSRKFTQVNLRHGVRLHSVSLRDVSLQCVNLRSVNSL